MIPVVYFRSSSLNTFRMCPMQYFLEYTLGVRGPSNQKADKGTIVHKVLEICALAKKGIQNGQQTIVDDIVGEIEVDNYDAEYLGDIISKVYRYYSTGLPHHRWTDRDFKDCSTWVWKALRYHDGMFDPRSRNIVDVEPHFDFEIKKEWAEYEYKPYGLKGHLALKGTIDLITQVDDGIYEVVDWKTGRRLDWATGEEKTQDKLFDDIQLRLYHYALKHLYPDVHTFLMTIFFINDGGPYTVHFQDSDLEQTEAVLRDMFEKIRKTERPQIVRKIRPDQAWICKRLCHCGKTSYEDPLVEYRQGQYTKIGQPMSICEQVRHDIDQYGIDYTISNYTDKDHVIGKYKSPGALE